MLAQTVSRHSSSEAEPKFDVVSIRPSKPGGGQSTNFGYGPDGYHARNQSMWATIMVAYYPLSYQYWKGNPLTGGPKWLEENYDIEAKVSPEDVTAWQRQGPDNKMLKPMLQAALRERCRLAIHSGTVEGPIYQLVVAKRGLKGMTPTKEGEVFPSNSVGLGNLGGRMIPSAGDLRFFAMSMAALAARLSNGSDLPIVDATGLPGLYDFTLARTPKEDNPTGSDPVDFQLAELGLELKRAKGTLPTLVIDHIERPTAN